MLLLRRTEMSLTYKISRFEDQVYLVGKGRLTAADCIGVVKRVLADPHCHPESTALIDLREAIYETSDMSDIIRVAKSIEKMASLFKNNVAIVARGAIIFPAELLAFHVRNLACIRIKVFADLAAAKAFCRKGRLSWEATVKGCGIGRG